MKITKVLTIDLKKAADAVWRIVPKRSTVTVAETMLIETLDEKTIVLKGTDLETGIEAIVKAKVGDEFACCVPSRAFTDMLALIDEPQVEISFERHTFLLNVESSKSQFRTLPAEEFPPVNVIREGEPIEADSLRDLIERVTVAASNDPERPALTGVYFQGQKADAADGFRAARMTCEHMNLNALIPATALREMARNLNGEATLTISKTDTSRIHFWSDGIGIVSKLIEDPFPDVDQIIPKSFGHEYLVDVPQLLKGIKQSRIFVKNTNECVQLLFEGDKLCLQAENDETGSNVLEVQVETQAEDTYRIGANYKYLREGVESCKSEKVWLKFNGPTDAIMIEPETGGYLYIMMPIHLGEKAK